MRDARAPTCEHEETNVSGLERLWPRIVRIVEVLEGMDGSIGDYMLSLETRVDKLERDLEHIEERLHSRADVSGKNLREQLELPA